MLGILGLVLALIAAVHGKEIVFINFPDVKSYNEIPCPKKCSDLMDFGLKLTSDVLGSVFSHVPFPVDFCEECFVGGMSGFKYDYKCFMSPDEDVFDHYINVKFPNFYINCTCDFSNNPSETAQKVNAGKAATGQCGQEMAQNKQTCPPIQCEGSGQGESPIKLSANLVSTLSTILHVDTRKGNPGAFPLMTSLETNNAEPITHEGPSEFADAWKCLLHNKESVICKLFSRFQDPFYDCLNKPQRSTHYLVHAILYEYGKCHAGKPKGGKK